MLLYKSAVVWQKKGVSSVNLFWSWVSSSAVSKVKNESLLSVSPPQKKKKKAKYTYWISWDSASWWSACALEPRFQELRRQKREMQWSQRSIPGDVPVTRSVCANVLTLLPVPNDVWLCYLQLAHSLPPVNPARSAVLLKSKCTSHSPVVWRIGCVNAYTRRHMEGQLGDETSSDVSVHISVSHVCSLVMRNSF